MWETACKLRNSRGLAKQNVRVKGERTDDGMSDLINHLKSKASSMERLMMLEPKPNFEGFSKLVHTVGIRSSYFRSEYTRTTSVALRWSTDVNRRFAAV